MIMFYIKKRVIFSAQHTNARTKEVTKREAARAGAAGAGKRTHRSTMLFSALVMLKTSPKR